MRLVTALMAVYSHHLSIQCSYVCIIYTTAVLCSIKFTLQIWMRSSLRLKCNTCDMWMCESNALDEITNVICTNFTISIWFLSAGSNECIIMTYLYFAYENIYLREKCSSWNGEDRIVKRFTNAEGLSFKLILLVDLLAHLRSLNPKLCAT